MQGRVNIARCSEHGLHGSRIDCFECGRPVDQVPMVPCDDAAIERAGEALCVLPPEWLTAIVNGDTDRDYPRLVVEELLRAAGETP